MMIWWWYDDDMMMIWWWYDDMMMILMMIWRWSEATLRSALLGTGISFDQVFGPLRFHHKSIAIIIIYGGLQKLYWECHQYASNVSKKSCQCPIHIQDSGTEDWISPPEELVARGWSFNVFNITNNLDEQTIAIYTFELQGHHHHILDRHELGPIFTFEGDLCQK